jgi:shikimate dehydrogenase
VTIPDARHLVGLIGADIGSSLSPLLHEREADRHGVRYLYQLIDLTAAGLGADDVGPLVAAAQRLGFRGLNITHPCKQEVLKYLDDLSPEAAELGAVNTVVFDRGRSTGHNTDRYGFAAGLARALPGVPVERIVLVGAGGAGAAVASAVARSGTRRLTLVDVEPDRARALARTLLRHHRDLSVETATLESVPELLVDADGLVNATPVGMEGHPGSPVPAEALPSGIWVADIVYRPLETELLRAARARGCRTAAGGGMVVAQAAESFRLFTGLVPDEERMYRDFVERAGGGGDA